jgi:NodT family efflux transporter outer membrane factor (OMF) lipoprotein
MKSGHQKIALGLRASSAGALLLVLGGCASVNEAPAFVAPVPASWTNGETARSPHLGPNLSAWWTGYRDPVLSRLIDQALIGSPTLEQALARVDAARALARSEGSRLLPQLDGSGNVRYERLLSRTSDSQNQTGDVVGQGAKRTAGTFQSGFDTSWEIDLFGRVRNAVAAADSATQVAAEEAEVARVTLVAELVRTYVELRAAERRRSIVSNDISARQRLVELVKNQKTAGLAGDFDVQRAVATSESSRSRLPTADLTISIARQRLATLVGQPAPVRDVARSVARMPILKAPRPSLPSDLLRTRPEIRQAERLIVQRAADVGVATAELYPRLTLSGTLTIAGNAFARPLASQLISVAGGPALTIPLLDWGQRRSIVDAREAQLKEAIAAYKVAVLTGVEEVEVSLASIRSQNARISRLQSAVTAAKRAFETADTLYRQGLTGLTERLTAETEWRLAELELAEAQEAAGVAVVRLYKALGAPSIDANEVYQNPTLARTIISQYKPTGSGPTP